MFDWKRLRLCSLALLGASAFGNAQTLTLDFDGSVAGTGLPWSEQGFTLSGLSWTGVTYVEVFASDLLVFFDDFVVQPTVAPVPTMPQWSLLIMTGLMVLGSVWALRRRQPLRARNE